MAVGRLCSGGPADGREMDRRLGGMWPWATTDWTGNYAGIMGWYVYDGDVYVWHPGAEKPA